MTLLAEQSPLSCQILDAGFEDFNLSPLILSKAGSPVVLVACVIPIHVIFVS